MRFFLLISLFLGCQFSSLAQKSNKSAKQTVTIVVPQQPHVRLKFGTEKLMTALQSTGFAVKQASANNFSSTSDHVLLIGQRTDNSITKIASLSGIDTSVKAGKAVKANTSTKAAVKATPHVNGRVAGNAGLNIFK